MVARLKDLQAGTADIEASAVVSVDGLIMASSLPADVEEDRVSAMSAAMLSLGERIASELGRGILDQVYIRGDNGYVVPGRQRLRCINVRWRGGGAHRSGA
jgi:predicted regulator of Ras-like GTPase activity (Roadblock/LC7/MglB family)